MKEKVESIIQILKNRYPEAPCALHYRKDYELMIAVRLSAQCTDARVNLVTPALFDAYPTLEAMANADISHVEELVHSCGFYFKIVDKKVAKRTAVQEQIILPLRAQNYATVVPGKKSERTVFTMSKFTIPDDKCLVVELNEKNGGRHQSFVIENEDLVLAQTINELSVK